MISRIVGTILKKNTKTKIWWAKLSVALVLSNVLFFMIFSSPGPSTPQETPREGQVEVQIKAELKTPFQRGKKVVLMNRSARIHLPGVLEGEIEAGEKINVWVNEAEAAQLFQYEEWEVLPYLPNFKFPTITRGEHHEIRY